MPRFRLRFQIYAAFAVMIGLLLVLSGVAFVQASVMRAATADLVSHAIPLQEAGEAVVRDMLNEETGVRGFIISYDASYLAPYQQGHDAVASDLSRLKSLAAGTPSESDAGNLAAEVQRVEQIHQQLIESARSGNVSGASLSIGESKTAFDALRATADSLFQRDSAMEAQADANSTAAAVRIQVSIIAVTLASLLLAGLMAVMLGRALRRQLVQAISETASNASQISSASIEQEHIASDQASAIDQVTSTTEELNAVAKESAERARRVADESHRALEAAQRGIVAMDNNVSQMSEVKQQVENMASQILALSEQTSQIGTIVSLIDDIAFQTNLLALNAAVEAARAGEHGKGFAVLAAEIRKLAEQSKSATIRIGELVNDIQHATNSTVMLAEQGSRAVDGGVRLAQEVSHIIRSVNQVVEETVTAVNEIAVASQQQLLGSQQIAQAMSGINHNMKQILTGVTQTQGSILSLNDMAAGLRKLV
ncbi:MAG TPA: methyl-accepting chemotaxis protein [Chloroflexota bacterium]|nr:methyl-accepting chemotaxis protein [Chloroflexota bacterium]